ncbi:MAG: prolyl oligopeptidase family serine peptidase [Armatimonadetes bacterium]|nr:prolyl oligopeptidase family serine peptidase [Armatimonadota bacterium]
MLAQEGYVIASVDNRGTKSPRGRHWRKIVHRQIGILSAEDQAKATQALLGQWQFADPARIGIWGYSGGGSSSLHAIFRFPDLYQMAMAVASVPNQRLYNSLYQERYMGAPEDNAEGYRRGSPLTYASGLKGNLLIVHGTGDDNCHYQGVEMLINELIAQDKPFTVMPYPNRSHALSEGVNTTRHFYSLLTRYLRECLPV